MWRPVRRFTLSTMYLRMEPEDSLIMGNEELSTIPEKESDEFVKSSVEDFVPIPSESEDTSGSDSKCDLPSYDDFSPINNLEVLENIENKDSYDSNLDELDLLVTPLSDANEDECFDPGGDIDEIDVFYILSDFEDGFYDLEGDVLYLESLLSDDMISNPPLKVFPNREPRSLSDTNNLKIMVKVVDPGIHEKLFSPTYVRLPFKDRRYLFFTYVIRIFLPFFTYPMDFPFLLSSGSEDTIFDPGISALEPVVSHRKSELRVDCYCDARFETDRDDTKSHIIYVFILNGGTVDWKSSKQSTTAMYATEAEYIAASEAVWIRKFILGLGIVPTINEPIRTFCDNSAALHFANEPIVQRGVRHYNRRYHYLRESITLGKIRFLKVHTDDNLFDPFTKALPK
uniref:Putative retrotransposon protein n=1 Tax=Tanacetum cinerariifolium TaxID=118510 RepID=A0A699HSQ2_TANCI|nr:putative retrotransposon protein [Tanacetum cinerariifolium]